ncbi:MAG: GNAT family N-acetyltransferase [Fimbriimonadaceae bacterium]|nr:GNAT family N-acetyltransferase [Fimbriimonadaceae bacterium]
MGLAVRRVSRGEEDAYLALLCLAFGLNAGQSALAFYSDPLFAQRGRWALFDGEQLIGSVSTLELPFGRGVLAGVSNVAIHPERRGQGHAQRMLEAILDAVGPACLFANRPELYRRLGFEVVDEVVRGRLPTNPGRGKLARMSVEEVRLRYESWSGADDRRFVRDEGRWNYWSWAKGVPYALGGGYLKLDSGTTRELLVPPDGWPLDLGGHVEWIGLSAVTRDLAIPLLTRDSELLFMTTGADWVPQMFLTDQF